MLNLLMYFYQVVIQEDEKNEKNIKRIIDHGTYRFHAGRMWLKWNC